MLDRRFAAQIACPGNALPPIKDLAESRGGFVATGTASVGMMEALNHFFAPKPVRGRARESERKKPLPICCSILR